MGSDLDKRGKRNVAEGTAKEVEGKVRKAVGKVIGSKSEQVKGVAKEVEGKVQKAVGKAQRDLDRDLDEAEES